MLLALLAGGCSSGRVCMGIAQRYCELAQVSCPPLERAMKRRPARDCQRAGRLLDRIKRLPPELKTPAAAGLMAELLGVGREYKTVQTAKIHVGALAISASKNRPTFEDESALVAAGPLACLAVAEVYTGSGPEAPAVQRAYHRVLRALAQRDLGPPSAWRSWCREVVSEKAPALDLLGG